MPSPTANKFFESHREWIEKTAAILAAAKSKTSIRESFLYCFQKWEDKTQSPEESETFVVLAKSIQAEERLAKMQEKAKRKADELALKNSRSADTRRKILAGAMVLTYSAKDESANSWFAKKMNEFLTRADDRALFDLPPIQNPPEKKDAGNSAEPQN